MDSRLVLPATVLADIAEHAAETYPEESCGILIGKRNEEMLVVESVRPTDNVAPPEDRNRRFVIDPRDVIETRRSLRRTDAEIMGFYHSHPDGPARPSPTDLPCLRLWPRTVWLIVEVRDGHPQPPRAWWLDSHDAEPVERLIESPAKG